MDNKNHNKQIDTAIVIVNLNGMAHLPACLSSLYLQTYKNLKIYFIDNKSNDDSVQFVKKYYSQIKIIKNRKNLGFAKANNIGIQEALKNETIKYIATLNNDTKTTSKWLEHLVKTIQNKQQAGAIMSKMLQMDNNRLIDSAGNYMSKKNYSIIPRGRGQTDNGQYDNTEECFAVCAGSALFKREMLESIKMGDDYFDSNFFAYSEDNDLSLRAHLMGWKTYYEPKSVVYHKGSATTNKLPSSFLLRYSKRNRLFTIIKNYPFFMWPKTINNSDYYSQNKKVKNKIVYIKIIIELIFHLPTLLKQRFIIFKNKKISRQEIINLFSKLSI